MWGRDEEQDAQAIATLKHKGLLDRVGKFRGTVTEDAVELTDVQQQVVDMLSDGTKAHNEVITHFLLDPNDADRYAALIEAAFGYGIEFGDYLPDNDTDGRIRQLERLADSNLLIVGYLDSIGLDGQATFQEYFASTSEGDAITVWLGADNLVSTERDAAYRGNVPLPGSAPPSALDDVYLGSQLLTATITHEFFHQLDRRLGMVSTGQDTNVMSLSVYLTDIAINSITKVPGLPFQSETVLNTEARANQSTEDPEYFADLGMTTVHDSPYANSLGREDYPTALEDAEPIRFIDSTNARDVECALKQYIFQVLTGTHPDEMGFVPCS
jgi:hypothetical protein